MIAETEIRLPPDAYDDATELTSHLAHRLGVAASAITHHVVVRRSLDARKGTPVYVLRCRVWIDEPFRPEPAPPLALRYVRGAPPAVVVGAGPAGLFAALTLIERGLRPIILARGHRRPGQQVLLRRGGGWHVLRRQTLYPRDETGIHPGCARRAGAPRRA